MPRATVADIDAHTLCLNDSETIRQSLISLISNGVSKIVVVDGGSTDGSVGQISDLPIEVVVSPPGIQVQVSKAMAYMQKSYTFQGEADQTYNPDFLEMLLAELEVSGFDAIQARKFRSFGPGFFVKGQSLFHTINQPGPGLVDLISGPQLWRTSTLVAVLSEFSENSYSSDTSLAEILRERGVRCGIGKTMTEEIGHLDYKSFLRRMRNYGIGDYHFFTKNWKRWSFSRRVSSVCHILKRYGVHYPLQAAKLGHPILGITYFWMILIHRYYFWIRRALGG